MDPHLSNKQVRRSMGTVKPSLAAQRTSIESSSSSSTHKKPKLTLTNPGGGASRLSRPSTGGGNNRVGRSSSSSHIPRPSMGAYQTPRLNKNNALGAGGGGGGMGGGARRSQSAQRSAGKATKTPLRNKSPHNRLNVLRESNRFSMAGSSVKRRPSGSSSHIGAKPFEDSRQLRVSLINPLNRNTDNADTFV